jgi:hypothetical protein
MKKLFLLFWIIAISVSCEKSQVDRNFDDDSSINNIDGTWVVISYEDVKNPITRKYDVESWNGMDVILTFAKDSLYGRNTTNSVMGNYTLENRTVHVIRYGGTKIGQPAWGNMFSDAVHKLDSFKINSNQLRFYYNDNKNSVTLSRTNHL